MKFPQFPHLKCSRVWACSTVLSPILILAGLLCVRQQCHAQQPLAAQSEISANPLSNINWFSGPQKVSLGDFADINIPPGYHFTDVHGARMILASFNDPIPDDLLGILAPTPGHWMAILEFSPVGYVKNPAITQINSGKVLKQILNQIEKQGPSSITSLTWQSQPVYDALNHVLEWSLQVATPSSKLMNETAVMFGRHGVLQLTIVQHLSDPRAPSVKQLVSTTTFKPGERYADYKRGDKVAQIGLPEIISGQTGPQTAGASGGGFGAIVPWIYCGFAACLLAGGVVVVRRRNKSQRRAGDPVPVSASKNKSPVSSVPKPVFNHSHHHRSKPFRRKHRKRIFDFTKFYTKVMRELSPYAYGPPIPSTIKSHSNALAGGYSHTSSNGHANVQSNGHATSHEANIIQTTKSEMEDLIAIQKSLIEQQKCLLEEQTRMIGEKRVLIEEQIAFLKAQSTLAVDPSQQDYSLKIAQ